MTNPPFRRLKLELHEEDVVPLPQLPEGRGRDRVLAGLLREIFTRPGGELAACSGAVLLDKAGQPRAVTAPFKGAWPRATTQAPELFAIAKRADCPRLVLFHCEPHAEANPEMLSLELALEMRALGLFFGIEIEDLLILKPRRHWTLSRIPILGRCLDCEASLDRIVGSLIAGGFELLPDSEAKPIGEEAALDVIGLLMKGPWTGQQSEARR